MTAKELINLTTSMDHPESNGLPYKDIENLMIEFAQHHVKKTLETIMDNSPYNGSDYLSYEDVGEIVKNYIDKNIQ